MFLTVQNWLINHTVNLKQLPMCICSQTAVFGSLLGFLKHHDLISSMVSALVIAVKALLSNNLHTGLLLLVTK